MTNKINNKTINLFLILVVSSLLLYLGGKMLDNKIDNGHPYGYLASDAFWDLTEIEYISEQGNYMYEPPWKCHGFKDCFGFTIPVWYHVASVFTIISGLGGYASSPFLPIIFSVIASLISFMIVRKINYKVALFSTPLFFLLYTQNFRIMYLWGYWDVSLAFIFLLGAVFSVINIRSDNMQYVLAVFIAATFMTHLVEFVYLLGFVVLYVGYMLYLKDYKVIKKTVISYIVATVIMSYFIINQYIGTFKSPGENLAMRIAGKPDWWQPAFQHFEIFRYVLLIGLVVIIGLCYIKIRNKDETAVVYIACLYLLSTCMFNYLPLGHFSDKALYMRWIWPVFFAPAFGFVVYYVYLYSTKFLNVNKFVFFLVIFAVISIGMFVYANTKVSASGSAMNKESWDAFNWLRENTPEDSVVLYVYGDFYSQSAYLLTGHRTHHRLYPEEVIEQVRKNNISNDMPIDISCCNDVGYAYRTSLFGLARHLDEDREQLYNSSFCDSEYYFFDKYSRYNELTAYNNVLISYLQSNLGFRTVYENGFNIILKKPENLTGRCLPDEGIRIR